MDRTADGLVILAPQTMGDGNARAYGQTDEQVNDQVGDGACGTDGGYGNAAAETAYDYKVGGVEQKLQNTREHDGNGVENDIAKQRAFQHTAILCSHNNTS